MNNFRITQCTNLNTNNNEKNTRICLELIDLHFYLNI